MNPIIASTLHGFLAGLAVGPGRGPRPPGGFGGLLGAAAREETIYRAGLMGLVGVAAPPGLSAAIFAADHVLSEQHTAGSGVIRFADVFLGGIFYERAYKAFGLVGAIAAHAAHNLAVRAGERAAGPRQVPGAFNHYMGRRKRRASRRRR